MKLMKKIMIVIISLIGIVMLVGCNASSNSAEDSINKFMKIRKSGNLDKLVDLISENYLSAQELTSEQYIQNLEEFDFRTSYKIKEYKISDIVEIDDNTKRVNTIIKFEDNTGMENSSDEVFALINENGIWKVSPGGILGSYTYEYKDIVDGKFTMRIDKEIRTLDSVNLTLRFVNRTDYDFSLGWIQGAKVIVETEYGNYISNLPPAFIVERGYDDYVSVDFPDLQGEVKKITLTSINMLENGLPSFDSMETGGDEFVIFESLDEVGEN